MIKNYFKTAWRNLWRNKTFSFLNITGLTIGMAGALLIFAWVQNEFSYDRFHANKDTLYKLWGYSSQSGHSVDGDDLTVPGLGPAIQREYPEVEAFTRVYWGNDRLIRYNDIALNISGLDVDKAFLTMFSFPLLKGDPKHALDDLNNIVLTEKLAKKIFGDTDPMDKLVRVNNAATYKVSGVIKKLPNNTQFNFHYLVSWAGNPLLAANNNDWSASNYETYVQLKRGTDAEKLGKKISALGEQHHPGAKLLSFLHPISKWRLYSYFENGKIAGGRIETVRLMMAIACLILLIACINFMNLSTARSEKRAKEVGVRKVIGASRAALIRQFLAESLLVVAIAGVCAIIIAQLCLPAFNRLTGKYLFINYHSPLLWCSLAAFILITGLLAGSYPAFFLSAFRPVKVLKGVVKSPGGGFSPRKVLVVVQFTVAIVLIVSTLIIYQQIKYVQARDSGYARKNLVEHLIDGDIDKNYEPLKNELISSGAAIAVSKANFSVTIEGGLTSGLNWGNMDPLHREAAFMRTAATGDFVKTIGLNLINGRDINLAEYPSDSAAVVINEAAARRMGFEHPVGQNLYRDKSRLIIVGLVKDFIYGSPYQPVTPMIIFGAKAEEGYNAINFRLNPNHPVASDLAIARQVFKKYNPAFPFEYKFVDKEYEKKFEAELKTGAMSAMFAALTIVISCLGLFGLAAYMAESRSKEIGIRKVLGASVNSIMQLLTKEFVILVIISIMIAVPIAWYAMSRWLQDFSYRVNISWFTFAAAGLLTIIVAVITVSSQAFKAAVMNPVKSIKGE